MDKYEYKVRSEEIKSLIAEGAYAEAAEIADTIDWRRVKSVMMLCTVSDLYKVNRRYEDAKNMLLLAYEKKPGGRTICYSLCELSIKTEEFVQAVNYYNEFTRVAPKDPERYILQYKLYEAQNVNLEERIGVLEELKKRDYREKWAYELAYLYHRVGLATRCVEECDELILWFGEGKYVVKAMELKMLHQPLTFSQQEAYDHRFDAYVEEAPEQYEEDAEGQNYDGQDVYGEQAGEFLPYEGYDNGDAETRWEDRDGETLPEELDIQVKTIDVGQYNTINLQEELAAGLQEVLGADGTGSYGQDTYMEPGEYAPNDAEMEETEVFFGETGEMEEAQLEAAAYTGEAGEASSAAYEEEADEEPLAAYEGEAEYEPPAVNAGEVRLSSYADLKKSRQRDFDGQRAAVARESVREPVVSKSVDAAVCEPVVSKSVDAAVCEPVVSRNVDAAICEPVVSGNVDAEVHESVLSENVDAAVRESAVSKNVDAAVREPVLPENGNAVTEQRERLSEREKAAAGPEDTSAIVMNQMREETTGVQPPKELADVLLQETDGQIRMVLPERTAVERQITGQMKIDDILAEWERMKKENEEKCKEEVRQHVLRQTGPMFTEFEAAVRDGLLEQLEGSSQQRAATVPVRGAAGAAGALPDAESAKELMKSEEDAAVSEAAYAEEAGRQEIPEYVEENDYTEWTEEQAGPDYGEGEELNGPDYAEREDMEGPGYAEEPENVEWEQEPEYAEWAQEQDVSDYGEDARDTSIYGEEQEWTGEQTGPGYMEEADYMESPESAEETEVWEDAGWGEGRDKTTGYEEDTEYIEDGEAEGREELAYAAEPEYEDEDAAEFVQEDGFEDADEKSAALDYLEALENVEEAEVLDMQDPEKESGVALDPDGFEMIGSEEEYEASEDGGVRKEKKADSPKDSGSHGGAAPERARAKARSLTREEKELFAPFIQNRQSREQLVKAIDGISMAAYTGNVVITGEEGMDTLTLAKNMIREVRMTDSNFSGKVAKITGAGLNRKNVRETLEGLNNGALIIQKASGMDGKTAGTLHVALQQEKFGIIVIMEDTRKAIQKLFLGTPQLFGDFTSRVDLEALSNDTLVSFGRRYAREKEYSIDDLGMLALHTRIEEGQTIDHVVTVIEVKQIVDEAIRHANRKTIGHFFDILLARRYDDEDMIILTEKDFVA